MLKTERVICIFKTCVGVSFSSSSLPFILFTAGIHFQKVVFFHVISNEVGTMTESVPKDLHRIKVCYFSPYRLNHKSVPKSNGNAPKPFHKLIKTKQAIIYARVSKCTLNKWPSLSGSSFWISTIRKYHKMLFRQVIVYFSIVVAGKICDVHGMCLKRFLVT